MYGKNLKFWMCFSPPLSSALSEWLKLPWKPAVVSIFLVKMVLPGLWPTLTQTLATEIKLHWKAFYPEKAVPRLLLISLSFFLVTRNVKMSDTIKWNTMDKVMCESKYVEYWLRSYHYKTMCTVQRQIKAVLWMDLA